MSLDTVKESFRVIDSVNEESIQTVVENDVIVPDVKPDIMRILLLDGEISITSTDISNDRINISGTIKYKILYISDDENSSIKSINTNAPFNSDISISNARAGMIPLVKGEIEHIEYTLLNGRKANLKSILKIDVKLLNEADKEVICDLKGYEDIQVLKENVNINNYIGYNKADILVEDSLEVPSGKPAIKEILRNDIKISNKDYKVSENKINVKGELNISTLYIADDELGSFQSMEHEVPFSKQIDIEGAGENSSCVVDYDIIDYRFEAGEDSDGELRYINGEVSLEVSGRCYERKSMSVISDAYTPQTIIEFEKESLMVEDSVMENKSQIILKDTIAINEESPDISEVFNVMCSPILSEFRILEDKAVVEGFIKVNMLYVSNNTEDPVSCFQQEIPFRQNLDIKGMKPDMKCDVTMDVEHYNYSVVSVSEVEIRMAIGLNIIGLNKQTVPFMVSASENSIEENKKSRRPSMTIYYTQQGDNLWKIAKRYFTTIEEIKRFNNIGEKDTILPGQQIIIPQMIVCN
ncbi:DUF3794 and LysM peptidoglycan-binding domain-containing protein [Pseudobacteroides cellulosolvens]|uniref:LysM domain-containing protein n=1 Tax=Pseudobacteroides cellulosolvens ATCC 35603 = DSM 2933 TaxID=398512 RepID=A0A0L6JVI8_9FIRM|nr:SPOCS domain-containing protein [Pseudobacteroides cellulosolvens]KNY29719.1 protein of unknown function DUF3794 [Pseudobacteroides cellulosolvens ATCC 35603 = DSM 2933]